MVKYYCDKLFIDIDYELYLPTVEDIIRLFLTIRGYSTAKVEKWALLKVKGQKGASKKSASVRQALKEKHNN